MQTLKDNIKTQILIVAQKLFMKKGFMDASVREIAADSNIGLGNIYNYFKSKDDIFRAIVQPTVTKFMQLYEKHHNEDTMDVMLVTTERYFENLVNEHVSLLVTNRSNCELLFFKSQGSSFERFKDEFIDYATQKSKQYFADMKAMHAEINISDHFIHQNISGTLNLYEELLTHKITKKKIKPIIEEHIRFNIAGWRGLTRV